MAGERQKAGRGACDQRELLPVELYVHFSTITQTPLNTEENEMI